MKKDKRGTKHKCATCSTLFYDLGRSPIMCPKCATPIDLAIQTKGRKGRAVPEEKELFSLPKSLEESLLDEDIPSDVLSEEDLLEDASELGDEKDEVNEVIVDAEPGDEEED